MSETQVKVMQEGQKIILPEGMSTKEVHKWVVRWVNEQQTPIAVNESTEYYPLDGAYALWKVLSEKFGWVDLVPTPGFFGDSPPAMISLEIGPNETVQVAWGRLTIPGVEGFVHTSYEDTENGKTFKLVGEVLKKDMPVIKEVMDEMRSRFNELTIYRRKAIRMRFPEEDDDFHPVNHTPKFIDLKGLDEKELILPREVENLVRACIFTPIEHSDRARALGIPMKRGILMEGPYGVGKTLTAYLTSKKAVDNGWTFIYLDHASDVPEAIRFARKYSPAVIFAEDIDREFESGERDENVDEILNTIDGIDSKESEVMVILTTNDVNKIHKAMLRPGRLDSVISFKAPDKEAVERLIKLYSRDLLASNVNLDEVSIKLEGQIPAVIREVVERSKLYAIPDSTGDTIVLTADALNAAADGMLNHLQLLKETEPDNRSHLERFGTEVGRELGKALRESPNGKQPVGADAQ